MMSELSRSEPKLGRLRQMSAGSGIRDFHWGSTPIITFHQRPDPHPQVLNAKPFAISCVCILLSELQNPADLFVSLAVYVPLNLSRPTSRHSGECGGSHPSAAMDIH
jgi:hypothetical protein